MQTDSSSALSNGNSSLAHPRRAAASRFSHIYIEQAARDHPDTLGILSRFPKATTISINRYTDLFNRPRQDWRDQKLSSALIVAMKRDAFLYQGTSIAAPGTPGHFYYNTPAMNCVYDCEYCYLQGIYPSSHIVIFINQEDYFTATQRELERLGSMHLSISYDTDLLAMERIVPWCTRWIRFAANYPRLELEIRTKSANFRAIQDVPPVPNVILAWTLSPQPIIAKYENGTPSFSARLQSISEAQQRGWKVRLCFDPILYVEQWSALYTACIEQTFQEIQAEHIQDCWIGAFRMNRQHLKRMRKQRSKSSLLHHPFTDRDSVVSYADDLRDSMHTTIRDALGHYLPLERIHCLT